MRPHTLSRDKFAVHADNPVGLGVGHVDEELAQAAVPRREVEHALRRRPVSARAARLLVVGLERIGHVMVQDHAHVRLVDPHAKRVRGDDDAQRIAREGFLDAFAVLVFHAGVVARALDAVVLEVVGQILDALAGAAVDDRRFILQAAQLLGDQLRLLFLGADVHSLETQIRAVETGHVHHRVHEFQPGNDVIADAGVRGGREGDNRRAANARPHLAQFAVARAEVVAPLRNTVRFVHGKQRNAQTAEGSHELPVAEPFGRHIEQPQAAVGGVMQRLRLFVGAH